MTGRRNAERRAVWLPVQLRRAGGDEYMTVTHDLSVTGAGLLGGVAVVPGEYVELAIHRREGTRDLVRGLVRRLELNDADRDGMFTHRIAVEFENPSPELLDLLAPLESVDDDLVS